MNKDILIIDDDKVTTSFIKKRLGEKGYGTVILNDPEKAMSTIEEQDYLIVILDIVMPKISGIDLLEQIKNYNGAIQVIILSGYITIDTLLKCLRKGASDCIFKPFDIEELIRAIDSAYNKLERWESLIEKVIKAKQQQREAAMPKTGEADNAI